MTERLQKTAARAGLGSRRQIETWIGDGMVRVNGRVAGLGDTVTEGDRVVVDGRHFRVGRVGAGKARVLLYHKPEGEVTSRRDPEGRPTVFDRLPRIKQGRWVAVGRLDINTSGLLLLTTDGELANAMMHPSGNVDREYACRIHGQVTDDMLQRLRDGVKLGDGMARFSDVVAGEGGPTNRWYYVVIMEGRNREVRRLWESQGVQVSRLKRVRYGAAFLPEDLRPGRWVDLEPGDVRTLREDVGLPPTARDLTLEPVKPSAGKPKDSSRKGAKARRKKSASRHGAKPPRTKSNPREGAKPRKEKASGRAAKPRSRT